MDQACSNLHNSAWNTHTSAVTSTPENALMAPYPDHMGTGYTTQGYVYAVEE